MKAMRLDVHHQVGEEIFGNKRLGVVVFVLAELGAAVLMLLYKIGLKKWVRRFVFADLKDSGGGTITKKDGD